MGPKSGVFRHAAIERGGGGGLWTDESREPARTDVPTDRREGKRAGRRAEPRENPRSDQNKSTVAERRGGGRPERAHGRRGTSREEQKSESARERAPPLAEREGEASGEARAPKRTESPKIKTLIIRVYLCGLLRSEYTLVSRVHLRPNLHIRIGVYYPDIAMPACL